MISLKYNHLSFSLGRILEDYEEEIKDIKFGLNENTIVGSEWTYWLRWVDLIHSEWIQKAAALKERWLQSGIKNVVVIGTGGSFLGAKAGLEFLGSKEEALNIIFSPSISSSSINNIFKQLKSEKFAILVISKSGTTLESSVLFRLFKEKLLSVVSEDESASLIACVTDAKKGLLRKISQFKNYECFVIPDGIGGRYSALTPVGLVPLILAGVDAERVIKGAAACKQDCFKKDLSSDLSAQYACIRHRLSNKSMECLISYEEDFLGVLGKAKQLFSESEGKNGKGIMPVILEFTPDLHSVGQLLQDGRQSFFNTVFLVKENKISIEIPNTVEDLDELNWLSGRTVESINDAAVEGTLSAHHIASGIENLVFTVKDWSEESFGYLYFFLCMSAMYSAYLFGVNPFDQPGVENYKKRMFSILKK